MLTSETLRYTLGLKVKLVRRQTGRSLTELADASGLSISYLSEIESGRKFPKPEKLLQLAKALQVGYDELVSPQLSDELDPLSRLLDSGLLNQFPFELFGMERGDVLGLVSEDPVKSAAFVQSFVEIAQSHDMQVEQFLYAALRAYLRLNSNYFPDLEEAAETFRAERGWGPGEVTDAGLQEILEGELGYEVGEIPPIAELRSLRSISLEGEPRRLLLHPKLAPSQRSYILGREIGFHYLGLADRPTLAGHVQVESFDQILAMFKASYFAGALMIDGVTFAAALEEFFDREAWDSAAYLEMMRRFGATPELFAHRITQILPGRLGLGKLYFLKFSHPLGTDDFTLDKILNMSGVDVPRGISLTEHYCRRWVTTRVLRDLDFAVATEGGPRQPMVRARRAFFAREEAEFFVIAAGQPPQFNERSSAITIGCLIDDNFKSRVRFWNDPVIGSQVVGLTCERCPVPATECEARRAPPMVLQRQWTTDRQVQLLEELRTQLAESPRGARIADEGGPDDTAAEVPPPLPSA